VFPEGLLVIVTGPQLSLPVAVPSVASLTTVSQDVAPGPVYAVTAAGAVIVGGTAGLSATKTVCVAVAVSPDALVAV